MDTLIYYVLAGLYLGGLFFTFGKYLFKLKNTPDIKFNHTYLLTMLLSMVATVGLTPLFFVPGLHMIDNTLGVGAIALSGIVGFCAGFTANAILNIPVAYFVNKMAQYEDTLKTANLPSPLPVKIKSPIGTVDVHKFIEAIVIVVLIIALCGVSVFAAVTYQASISGSGSITGVGVTVYSDAAGQVNLNSISWGNINPGGSVSTTIYIKSTSNTPVVLSLSSNGWTPAAASGYLTLSWDYNSVAVQPGQIVKVVLTLAASSTATPGTNFSFNCVITATSG